MTGGEVKMSGRRKTEKASDDASQGGVADPEAIVDRLVTSAVSTLRQEFETAIDKAVSTLKEHFSKELTEAVDDLYARLDQVEQKVSESINTGTEAGRLQRNQHH